MATEGDPDPAPPPEAMSWERRVSRPPKLNDQSKRMPIWARPFATPQTEHMLATQARFMVIAKVAAPYVLGVALAANAAYGVPMRHMLFSVPATTLIGVTLMITIGAAIELLGWISGYRPALVSWTLDAERTGEALAGRLESAAAQRGFIVVWSKDGTFVATRNVEQAARGLVERTLEQAPRRLSLLGKKDARTRTLKVETHGACFWDTGETEQLESLARSVVQLAAEEAPWIAASARWQGTSRS